MSNKHPNAEPATEAQTPNTASEQDTQQAQQTPAAADTQDTAAQTEQTGQVHEPSELEKAQLALAQEHESHLRLAAEYDNYRKRSQKEKESLYTEIRSETVEKFLPVYDNLARALAQDTQDTAYKKGVEMTMNQLVGVMEKLGVTSFGEVGEGFDPQIHNAVMHAEDETLGENVIAEVFQKGFRVGDRVVRFAMVKVAN